MSTRINRDPAEIQLKNVDPLVNFFAPPTPLIEVLLQTKAQLQFERTVNRTVQAFFRVFLASNHVQFFPPSRLPNLLFG